MWFFEDEKRTRNPKEHRSSAKDERSVDDFQDMSLQSSIEKLIDQTINHDEAFIKLNAYPY